MPVHLNHTIVAARDRHEAANFLAEILGRNPPTTYGPFAVVELDNDVSLDFLDDPEVHPRHYAFLVSEAEFDEIFGRIQERRLDFWADPFERLHGAVDVGRPTETSVGVHDYRNLHPRCQARQLLRQLGE